MAKKISAETRVELVRAIGERYRAGTRKEKLRILDEFVAVTGYHRKHRIRVLNTEGSMALAKRSRSHTVIRQRVAEANRVHKLLESANIKLAPVVSDVLGASGRAMLRALVRGERDPCALARLAHGVMTPNSSPRSRGASPPTTPCCSSSLHPWAGSPGTVWGRALRSEMWGAHHGSLT